MPPIVLVAATVLVALCPFFVPRVGSADSRARTYLLAVVPLAYVALLVAFVFGCLLCAVGGKRRACRLARVFL